MISHQFVFAFQRVHVSNVPPHFSHPKPQVSSEMSLANSKTENQKTLEGSSRARKGKIKARMTSEEIKKSKVGLHSCIRRTRAA